MKAVVVVLQGCPVGWLGAYGNEWVATPNLDRLAAEGAVFDRHTADCPDPAAARRAWRTGRGQVPAMPEEPLPPAPSPKRGGGAEPKPPPRFGEGVGGGVASDLLTLLRSRGVFTALVRATRPANDAPSEFYAGWEKVFDARPAGGPPLDPLLAALPGFLDELERQPEWLLWIEIDALLPPWDVPPGVFEAYLEDLLEDEEADGAKGGEDEPLIPWPDPAVGWFDREDIASWELLHRSFAAAVTAVDADLGRVFDLLRGRGLDRTAAWVLTADYGFPLGEHGVIGPFRPYLHEELVHTPLVVRLPEATTAGRRAAGFTQPADLMPTLLGLFGVESPAGVAGFDLRSLWEGTTVSVRPHAIAGWVLGPAGEWAVRTPDWALLLPAVPHPDDDPRPAMLFAKPDDRWEVNDLRSRHLELAEELETALRSAAGGPVRP